jgi:hypothetical protein
MSLVEVLAVIDVVIDVVDKGIEASEKKKIKRSKPGEKKKKDKSKKPQQEEPQQPQEKPKPLMDLRHILKKYEKKVEQKPIQQVDFYGSMAAIPFLKTNKPEEKKKKKAPEKSSAFDERTKDKKVSIAAPAADVIGASDEATQKTEEERTAETLGERKTISYLGVDGKEKKVEIIIFKDYDEEQLKLWKRTCNDDDDDFMMDDGPAQMLPLMPSARPKSEKKRPSHFEIGHNRPEEWLNPDLKTQDKMTYKVKDGVAEGKPPSTIEAILVV